MSYVFLDIESMFGPHEVGGWQNSRLMGFGIAVTTANHSDLYKRHVTPQECRTELFHNPSNTIVTYNGESFDLPIITTPNDQYRHIDLLSLI